MTDSFLIQLCTVMYDRKPFEQIKSQILTCYLKQQSAKTIRTYVQRESDLTLNESV